MPDEPSPEIQIVPLGVLCPTVFSLARSNVEYLLAIMSGRLCALSDMDTFGALQNERREASDLYHTLMQISRSMEHYRVGAVELRLPVPESKPVDGEEST